MNRNIEKVTPATVASGLVNRFTTAIPNSVRVIKLNPTGNLQPKDPEVQGHAVFAVARVGVAQHEHRQPLHGETPDHAKRVEIGQEGDLATADDDGQDLESCDDIDDAVGGAELAVRLPEPVRQDAIFGDAIEHAVRAHDRRVHGSRQDERPDDNDKTVEDQA